MTIQEVFAKAENGTLTWEQFQTAMGGAKFVDLTEGNYVSKQKYDDEDGCPVLQYLPELFVVFKMVFHIHNLKFRWHIAVVSQIQQGIGIVILNILRIQQQGK